MLHKLLEGELITKFCNRTLQSLLIYRWDIYWEFKQNITERFCTLRTFFRIIGSDSFSRRDRFLNWHFISSEKTASAQVRLRKATAYNFERCTAYLFVHRDNQLSKQRASRLWRRPSDLEGLDWFQQPWRVISFSRAAHLTTLNLNISRLLLIYRNFFFC